MKPIRTPIDAPVDPAKNFYVVIRLGSNAQQQPDSFPAVRHENLQDALKEAQRLADANPTHPRGFAVCGCLQIVKGSVKKPDVNWSIIPPWFKYVGIDATGEAFAFTDKPSPATAFWDSECGRVMSIPSEYAPKLQCHWKDSLVERTPLREEPSWAIADGYNPGNVTWGEMPLGYRLITEQESEAWQKAGIAIPNAHWWNGNSFGSVTSYWPGKGITIAVKQTVSELDALLKELTTTVSTF